MLKILVTGGAGFIGSAVIRHILKNTAYHVINVDCLTYAGNLCSLKDVAQDPRYTFVQLDICDKAGLIKVFAEHQPTWVMHLAAESHVDRSIQGSAPFIQTNIVGTYNLLETALDYWRDLNAEAKQAFRFHQVSTDEVYGSLGPQGAFSEDSPYRPNSPYSASKAAADMLVRAWWKTYKFPVIITNCSNNYGPYQYPEKLIPFIILRALNEQSLPVYGDGLNVRDWLYVDDHAEGLLLAVSQGQLGETYNIGGNCERTNIEVVSTICDILDELKPPQTVSKRRQLISYVTDRPGHDRRYAINAEKIARSLGFAPKMPFEQGLAQTVKWYLAQRDWLDEVQSRNSN